MHHTVKIVLALMLAAAAAANAQDDLYSPNTPAPPCKPAPPGARGPLWGGPGGFVLYDNGPVGPYCNVEPPPYSCPCPGPPPGQESQRHVPNDAYGYNHQAVHGFRLADDFVVPPGESWLLEAVTFFDYQSGSTTQSTITGITLRIWDGPPGDSGSRVLCGDTTTNLQDTSLWSGMYRSSSGCPTDRPVMATTVRLDLMQAPCDECPGIPNSMWLEPGVYWLDWDADGSLPSGRGPFAPPVTPNGAGPDSRLNARQFRDGLWRQPGEPCEFPFIIEGENCPTSTATETSTWGAIKAIYETKAADDTKAGDEKRAADD